MSRLAFAAIWSNWSTAVLTAFWSAPRSIHESSHEMQYRERDRLWEDILILSSLSAVIEVVVLFLGYSEYSTNRKKKNTLQNYSASISLASSFSGTARIYRTLLQLGIRNTTNLSTG